MISEQIMFCEMSLHDCLVLDEHGERKQKYGLKLLIKNYLSNIHIVKIRNVGCLGHIA